MTSLEEYWSKTWAIRGSPNPPFTSKVTIAKDYTKWQKISSTLLLERRNRNFVIINTRLKALVRSVLFIILLNREVLSLFQKLLNFNFVRKLKFFNRLRSIRSWRTQVSRLFDLFFRLQDSSRIHKNSL